ncbi:MAG: DUF4240 domain-containing protein [Chitinophagaceae bacterium]|nr:DUF4240 domain-containing protein [Chitinophagaceae bacterium]
MQNFYLILFFIFVTTGCGQTQGDQNKEEVQTHIQSINFIKADSMNEHEFWKLIDYSFFHSNGNQEIQENILVNKLVDYTPEQIIEFEKIFRKYVIEADDFKVLAAEKIIEGWVTDDPYLYFRCWLIGQGENTFKETLKSPDYLADKIHKEINTQFEELMYVADKAYMQRTEKKEEDETFPRNVAYKSGLDYDFGAPPTKGTDWTEDQLPKLYPKLWAKFH